MLTAAILSALIILALLVLMTLRARRYLRQHPELITDGTPPGYRRCHETLQAVIERYKVIEPQVSGSTVISWHSPNGYLYVINEQGVQQRQSILSDHDVYRLAWPEIGGVGVRMQPGFRFLDADRDGYGDSLHTTGYSFHLLIVPASGSTIDIPIPINGQPDAINFVAHTIALARHHGRRINVFGFDRPPTPHRQRISPDW